MKGRQRPLTGLLLTLLLAAPAGAADFTRVGDKGSGSTEYDAVRDAYWQMFQKAAIRVLGSEASTGAALMKGLEDEFNKDFQAFQTRFFSGEEYRCKQGDTGYRCLVRTQLNQAALKDAVFWVLEDQQMSRGEQLRLVLFNEADTGAGLGALLLDELQQQLTGVGHRPELIRQGTGSVAREHNLRISKDLKAKAFDFTMRLVEVEQETAPFAAASGTLTGSLRFSVRVDDPKGGVRAKVISDRVTGAAAGANAAIARQGLDDELAVQAARLILREFNELQGKTLARRDRADERKAMGAGLEYAVIVAGVLQDEREKLRAVRNAIRALFDDARPQMDRGRTDRAETVYRFTLPQPMTDEEAFIDELYFQARGGDYPGFRVERDRAPRTFIVYF